MQWYPHLRRILVGVPYNTLLAACAHFFRESFCQTLLPGRADRIVDETKICTRRLAKRPVMPSIKTSTQQNNITMDTTQRNSDTDLPSWRPSEALPQELPVHDDCHWRKRLSSQFLPDLLSAGPTGASCFCPTPKPLAVVSACGDSMARYPYYCCG